MLNNISNFFSLIRGRKIKKTLVPNDMIAIGVRDTSNRADYQPSGIFFKDLEAQIAAGVTPVPPTLQTVVNTGNSITNFGGIGNASISSINFVNNRALYLNTDANPTIRIVDNLNASNNLQIDIDTLTLDGVSYNWSNIINQLPAWLEYNATDKTIWCNGQSNGTSNLSYGEGALKSASFMANLNTAIGKNALSSVVMGGSNTALGFEALKSNLSNNNTAVGSAALTNNTTGSSNTAIGKDALTSNTTGKQNTAIGLGALFSNTDGSTNIAIGGEALRFNTTGINNNALGYQALYNNTTGGNNIAIGYQALRANTIGNDNTTVGAESLSRNTTGNSNTAIGQGAGYNTTTGSTNVYVGAAAGSSVITGGANVIIGASGANGLTSGVNNIFIGANTASGAADTGCIVLGINAFSTGDNQFVVGSTGVNAGSVVSAVQTSTKYWNVIINGVAQKILLA